MHSVAPVAPSERDAFRLGSASIEDSVAERHENVRFRCSSPGRSPGRSLGRHVHRLPEGCGTSSTRGTAQSTSPLSHGSLRG